MARRRKKTDWMARRLRGLQGGREELETQLAEDRTLLEDIDNHDGDVDSYGAKFLADNLERLDRGFALTPGQRAFARRLRDQLDGEA